MIDILTNENGAEFGGSWQDSMFRLRHRVFKERLGWEVGSEDGKEQDVFDEMEPTYLVARTENAAGEEVTASWRLLPTTDAYMLSDVFPELLEGMPAPEGATILEASRFCVDDRVGEQDRSGTVNRLTSELFCALVEHCLATGITEIVTVYDNRIARLLPRIGCRPTWQSGFHRIGKSIAVAGRFPITEQTLKDLRAAAGISESVVGYAAWKQPAEQKIAA